MAPGNTAEKKEIAGERIAKVMARAGLCSRREAERWIADGRVLVDGVKLTTPATLVGPENTITVDGEAVPVASATRLWRYHKPGGLLTTHKDPGGRPTVFERLPSYLPRLIFVGRLDFNSEGLLLLTNDGGLARKLELPATGWTRRYRVRVHGRVEEKKLAALAAGITIDAVRYKSIKAELERQQGANAWLSVTLVEGKNREIRKVMDALGYTVNRLIRIAYGPFQLGNLGKEQLDEVSPKILRDQIGWDTGHAHRRRQT